MRNVILSLSLGRSFRQLLALGLAVWALAAPAGAGAASVTVSLTANGPLPQAVTVTVGDTVTFVNNDTGNHSIVFTTGAIVSPVITPTQSWTLTVGNPGKLGYKQTGFTHHNFSGTVEVQAAPAGPGTTTSLTLSSSRTVVRYGLPVGLRGRGVLASGT